MLNIKASAQALLFLRMKDQEPIPSQALGQSSFEATMQTDPADFQATIEAALPSTTRELLMAIREAAPQAGVIPGKRNMGSNFTS